jgi:ubiquitin-protein ligase E3 C
MGDDEFFSLSNSLASTNASTIAPRNSLSFDELTSFSRKLLNIAFTLYWREDQTNVQEGGVPGISLKWEGVREKLTKCLRAIHARE